MIQCCLCPIDSLPVYSKRLVIVQLVIACYSSSYWFTGPETVADVTLEDDAVALGEPECLVRALQSGSIRYETREDGRVSWAAVVSKET